MWICSAPAAATRAISSASTPKSADRIDGAILIIRAWLYHARSRARSRAPQPDGRERIGAVTIGPRAEISVAVEGHGKVGRRVDAPARMGGQKFGDDGDVFFGLRRARRVHESPVRLHERRGGGHDRALTR